jgi:hypothetical protein
MRGITSITSAHAGEAVSRQCPLKNLGFSCYTVKCCFTISALRSSFFPAATTTPLAITT